MSIGVDFDFAKWIAVRRGSMEQSAREGAVYAFAGERKVRRTLAMARPVTMALEATTRLWRDVAFTAGLLGPTFTTAQALYATEALTGEPRPGGIHGLLQPGQLRAGFGPAGRQRGGVGRGVAGPERGQHG